MVLIRDFHISKCDNVSIFWPEAINAIPSSLTIDANEPKLAQHWSLLHPTNARNRSPPRQLHVRGGVAGIL